MKTGTNKLFVLAVAIALSSLLTLSWMMGQVVMQQEFENKLSVQERKLNAQSLELGLCQDALVDWCDGSRLRVNKCGDKTYVCFCASDKDFGDGSSFGTP